MSAVSKAVAFICGCAVVCSVLNLISPNSKMKKPARIVLAVFFICSLISPVKNAVEAISRAFDFSVQETQREPEAAFDYEQLVFEQTVQNLANSVNNMLLDEEITAKDISVNAHISSNKSIKLDSINIYIDEASNVDILKIETLVSTNFGLVPNITVGSDNGT